MIEDVDKGTYKTLVGSKYAALNREGNTVSFVNNKRPAEWNKRVKSFFDRKYDIGFIISDFRRIVKNPEKMLYLFAAFPEQKKIAIGKDDKAMAVKVKAEGTNLKHTAFPHVTVAINPDGGKPMHSKQIPEGNFEKFNGMLRGIVTEISN